MMIPTLIVIAMLIASVTLLVMWMRQKRETITAIIPVDSIRKHLVLVCLVRGVELLIMVAIMGVFMLICAGSLLAIDPWRAHPGLSKAYTILVMIAVPSLLVAVMVVLPAWRRQWSWDGGYFRNVLRVDSNSVSTFAFVFACFAAHDFYQLWPYRIPDKLPEDHSAFLNREFLYILVFLVLFNRTNSLLLRILEMRRKEPPANPGPHDPFVPFNPYDLSQNKPVRPLPQG